MSKLCRAAYLTLVTLLASTASAEPDQNLEGEIISSGSYFHVLVYSDGLLSGFGHDHIIAAQKWRGNYQLSQEGKLQASLRFHVQDLAVDRESDRALYPHLADKTQPSKEDIAGTKKNMLSAELLDGKNHPVILARVSADIKHKKMKLDLTLGGNETTTHAPYKISCDNETMTAKGTFRIDHSDLKLKPFSALFGTIKVAETLDFTFSASLSVNCETLSQYELP